MVSISVLKRLVKLERTRPGRLERIPWLFCVEVDLTTGGWTFDWVNIRLAMSLGFVAKLRKVQNDGEVMVLQLARPLRLDRGRVLVYDPGTRQTAYVRIHGVDSVRIKGADSIRIEPEEADEGRYVNSEIDSG